MAEDDRQAEEQNSETTQLADASWATKKYPGVGLLLGLLSGSLYGTCSLLLRLLKGKANPYIVTFYRGIIGTLCFLPIAIIRKDRINGFKEWAVLIAIGLIGTCVNVCQYNSFQMIHLSDSNAIISTCAAVVAILNCLFTCKPCSCLDIFVIIACVLGAILCCQPTFIFKANDYFSVSYYIGLALACLASLFWGMIYLAFSKSSSSSSIQLIATFSGNIIPMAIYMGVTDTFGMSLEVLDVTYVILIGLISVLSVLLLIVGIKIDNPLMVSIGRTADIPLSVIFDIAIFEDTVSVISIIGFVIIMGAIIFPAVVKIYQSSKLPTQALE